MSPRPPSGRRGLSRPTTRTASTRRCRPSIRCGGATTSARGWLSAATTARCGCGTWNLATGDEQAVLTGHDGPVMSVVVTADGATAVSGSDDSRVRVWDLATLDRTRLLDRGLHRRLLRRYTGQALKSP